MSMRNVEVSAQIGSIGMPEGINVLTPGSSLTVFDYSDAPRTALIVHCSDHSPETSGVYRVRLPSVVDESFTTHDDYLVETRAMIARGSMPDLKIASIGSRMAKIPLMLFNNTFAELRVKSVLRPQRLLRWLGGKSLAR